MWPFTRNADAGEDDHDRAVRFAAERWAAFSTMSGVPANIHLRDRIAFFAADFVAELTRRFPALRAAPDEVMLLIIAEGVAASGLETRRRIELQLGIVLP
jgi:hypothetical protein